MPVVDLQCIRPALERRGEGLLKVERHVGIFARQRDADGCELARIGELDRLEKLLPGETLDVHDA